NRVRHRGSDDAAEVRRLSARQDPRRRSASDRRGGAHGHARKAGGSDGDPGRGYGKMTWVFWAIAVAALIHVAEEYWGGFLGLMQQRVPGVTLRQFLIINALFVLLCIIAAVVGTNNLVLSLSVASLILINALIHAGATL